VVFWNVVLYSDVVDYQRFGGRCCLVFWVNYCHGFRPFAKNCY